VEVLFCSAEGPFLWAILYTSPDKRAKIAGSVIQGKGGLLIASASVDSFLFFKGLCEDSNVRIICVLKVWIE
jgi:hypothetical protein